VTTRAEKKAMKEKAQEILLDAITLRWGYFEEYAKDHGIEYSDALVDALTKEAQRLAKAMGFVKVPGLLEPGEKKEVK
jgi:hypothetical protein